MRFISPHRGFKIRVIPEETEQLANGMHRVTREGFIAEFRGGDFTDLERSTAYERFGGVIAKGSRMEDDMVTPYPNDDRIGTFDTRTITDAGLRARVEAEMLGRPEHGRFYLHVEEPRLRPPWPRYDELRVQGRRTLELVVEAIVKRVQEDGYRPEDVLAYERQNAARPEVLEAVAALGEPVDGELVEVTA